MSEVQQYYKNIDYHNVWWKEILLTYLTIIVYILGMRFQHKERERFGHKERERFGHIVRKH